MAAHAVSNHDMWACTSCLPPFVKFGEIVNPDCEIIDMADIGIIAQPP